MAIHSSVLTWKISCAEELSRLRSIGSQRVGHDWAHTHTHTHTHTLLLLLHVTIPNTKDKAMLLLIDTNNSLLTNSSFFHDLITTKVANRVYSGSSGSISSFQSLSNVRFRQYIVRLLIKACFASLSAACCSMKWDLRPPSNLGNVWRLLQLTC